MLRTRLFFGFAALILLFGVLSGWFGIDVIKDRIVQDAQNRVRLDLSSARSVYAARLHEMETVVAMTAAKRLVVDTCKAENWNSAETRARLHVIRRQFGLDFLTLVSPQGEVVIRAAPPYVTGDLRPHDPLVARALGGENCSGTSLMTPNELETEALGLADRAFLALEETPRAAPTLKETEERGMVMLAAAPVKRGTEVLGMLYGGTLLNRNFDFIDLLRNSIYSSDDVTAVPAGSATIFLRDTRIATTVLKTNGNRAIGTRASQEVSETVLDNGQHWIGRAFVVKEWYLTAYEPLRDLDDRIIGMLYVGIQEAPFVALGRTIILRYVYLTGGVVVLSLVVAFFLAGKLSRPIHRLVLASRQMRGGSYPSPVTAQGASREVGSLIHSFNDMTFALQERERKLNQANEDLTGVNRDYMETLGFVTHELNTPIASIMNYVYLLKNNALGPLTDKQEKAVRVMDITSRRLVEMVRHYLNLSRIERDTLSPNRRTLRVRRDVLMPLLETHEPEIRAREVTLDVRVDEQLKVHADETMLAEVFENLVSNALKYGRDGGTVLISSEEDGAFARFTVRNDGEGIPRERIGSLFQKFVRLEESTKDRSVKGTGLGLFITKAIVEAHGGAIEATSEPGRWAAFTFTVPRGEEDATSADGSDTSKPEGSTP